MRISKRKNQYLIDREACMLLTYEEIGELLHDADDAAKNVEAMKGKFQIFERESNLGERLYAATGAFIREDSKQRAVWMNKAELVAYLGSFEYAREGGLNG